MVGIDKVKVRFPSPALAHVSHFSPEREPWAYKQSTRFFLFSFSDLKFLKFYICQLCFCLCLPASLFDQLLAAFSALCPLFGSFLLYVQAGLAASVHVNMQGGAVLFVSEVFIWPPCLPRRFRNFRLGLPPRPYFPKRPSLWVS